MRTMLEDGNPPEDQTAFTGTTARRWLPLSLMCCFLCIPGLIAIIVVVSLIPIYIKARNVDSINTSTSGVTFSAVYATDLTDASSSINLDYKTLAADLEQQYGIDGITVDTASFGSLDSMGARKKRRGLASRTTKDYFFFRFTIKYKPGCRSDDCRNKFKNQCSGTIQNRGATITLTFRTFGGGIIRITIIIFWFGPGNTGFTTTTTPIATTISNTASTSPVITATITEAPKVTTAAPITTPVPTTNAPTTMLPQITTETPTTIKPIDTTDVTTIDPSSCNTANCAVTYPTFFGTATLSCNAACSSVFSYDPPNGLFFPGAYGNYVCGSISTIPDGCHYATDGLSTGDPPGPVHPINNNLAPRCDVGGRYCCCRPASQG